MAGALTGSDAPAGPRRGLAPGLYVHVPFCASRCAYCTFVTSTETALATRTAAALACEIRRLARPAGRRLATVYLGGGTPSLFDASQLGKVLGAIGESFVIDRGAEVTLEANPDDVTAAKLVLWRELGVTRVSLGVQSFSDRVLAVLGRRHDAARARAAAREVLAAGFELSLDLMLGLPALSVADLEGSLAEAVALRPHHVSVYLLEMDKPHELVRLSTRRPDLFPDADGAARQYLVTGRRLTAAGYRHYEVSNFALPGHQARHNTRYWRGTAVFAAGVAAHGQSGRRRWANLADLSGYLAAGERGRAPRAWSRRLAPEEAVKERVMLGLRLAAGVPAAEARRCAELQPSFAERLADFSALGLAREVAGRVRLTPRGWLVSNELFATLW